MSLTVLEVLENAEYNISTAQDFQVAVGLSQLRNAIKQLNENGDADCDFRVGESK